MINKATIVGRLGQDPETRFTQGGTAVCNFSVATDERWKDASGEQKEHTEWHRIVVWGKLAENCQKYLTKGRQVYVEGKIKTREWEDRDGNKRHTTEIIASEVKFLGSKGEGGGSSSGEPHADSAYADSGSSGGEDQSFNDDDIPF